MEIAVIRFIILGVISGLTKGAGVLPDGPLNAAVGETVMFNTTLTPPEKPFVSVSWRFGERDIINSNSGNTTEPEYEDRITLFRSTASLELRNLSLNDSGNYRVSIIPDGGKLTEGTTRLEVYERISGASVTSSTNLLIEGNPVNLTCDAAGSVFTRKWMKDGSDLILSGNITLHDENRVLSLSSLSNTDSGEYSCKISNPINTQEARYIMVVNYGPENVQITGPREIEEKQALTLTCSAKSEPSATYTWKMNGTELHTSSVFTKNITEFSDGGSYTCEAMNNVTGRTSSAVHGLTVTVTSPGGLSAGAIAGITIAVLVILAVGAAGGYYIYRKKINKEVPTPNTEMNQNVYERPSEPCDNSSAIYENTSAIYENTSAIYDNVVTK